MALDSATQQTVNIYSESNAIQRFIYFYTKQRAKRFLLVLAGEANRRLKFQWKIIFLETMNDESYPLAAYSNLYVLVLA